jgi:hypothetical protein
MLGIIHIAGPMIEGVQKCSRCGYVLIDQRLSRDVDRDRLPPGWQEDAQVSVSGRNPIQYVLGAETGFLPCDAKVN